MTDISRKLDKYVKLSREERKKRRKWITRQSEELEFEAFLRQQKYYFELSKHKDEHKSLLYFAAYTLAVIEIYDRLNPKKCKNKVVELGTVIDSTELKAKSIKRDLPRKIWDGMLNRKYTIMKLHYLGVSTRDISKQIEDLNNNFTPSHTSISKFIKEMKDEI